MDTFNILGLTGTIITVIAYLLSSFGILSVGMLYQAMNGLGSILLVISLTSHFNLPALILESTWCVISLSAILRIMWLKKTKKA
jgi:hypothetical protein